MITSQKSLVFMFCVLLSGCGSNKAAPKTADATPPATSAPSATTPSVAKGTEATGHSSGATSVLQSKSVLYTNAPSTLLGLSYVPSESSQSSLSGEVCMHGEPKTEAVPASTRFTLESSIVEFSSGADGEIWNRHTVTLRTTVATSRTILDSPVLAEGSKKLSTAKFEAKCGTQYVASIYEGAVIATTLTYDVAAAEAVPEVFTAHVDSYESEKTRALGATFEGLVKQAKTYKTAKNFDSAVRQEPLLLNEEAKDLTTIEAMKLFAQKVTEAKTPIRNAFTGYFEVAPYPLVK